MRKPTHLRLKLAIFSLFLLVVGVALLVPCGCPIRHLTGLICPGCGMSRAWEAVFHLDFRRAVYYHPMFWCVPVLLLFALYDFRLFRKRAVNIVLLGLLAAAGIASYLWRLSAFLQGSYRI